MALMRNTSPNKQKKGTKMISRLLLPMLLLVLFQLVVFFVVLIAGGEFTYIKKYAYDTLAEKTENRKDYLETELLQKIPYVQESAEKINVLVGEILEREQLSVADLQRSRELNRRIMDEAVDPLVNLLRRSTANDVYLILETGALYDSEGSGTTGAKNALYLRDLDPTSDAGDSDLLMEIGSSSVSQEHGIALDSGWTVHFDAKPDDPEYDYFYRTIRTAQENSECKQSELGLWTGFSRPSRSAAASMKYTLPLIAEDGTVYGILGIGMTENTILAELPANDFLCETACYVLGCSRGSGQEYEIITHSGISFQQLLMGETVLKVGERIDETICAFGVPSSVEAAGSVQEMTLYDAISPYAGEQWALISVEDRFSVLQPFHYLIQMLLISAVISLGVSIVVIIWSCRKIVQPISDAIRVMSGKYEYSQVLHFPPSKIYEIDMMTDAITQLQINVQAFSSQVSTMIRIANVELGTFMYDRSDDSVFVGQSMLHMMRSSAETCEDTVMSREAFLSLITDRETKAIITEGLAADRAGSEAEFVREYSVTQADGSDLWMRMSIMRNQNKSIGILQDITGVVTEKKRIEYERDYDLLTGLLNRHAYDRRLEVLFRQPDVLKVAAIIMLNLDNLKYVNDTYGRDFGDDYIRTAATALKGFEQYGGVVSRLSGDEFNICLYGFNSKEEVRRAIAAVREQFVSSDCLLADGTHFRLRASMGISWYPDDAKAYDMLIKYADFAIYTIKHATKGEIAEFDMAAYEKDAVLITGVEEMNRIIDDCRVQYAFHSIISARDGSVFGYEALMRPQSTILPSPPDLLRIAKSRARLNEIERLTWTKALDDFQEQIDAGRVARNCHIFVNSISSCSLERSDIELIEATHAGLLSNIVLEILEGEMANEEYILRKIARMKKWNASIALDDFGSGYNSELALITMNPNIIKIDRSLISGCDRDASRRTIIRNLVKLGRRKQILVLAEGVETEQEMRTVIFCGVDLLQGYYINRPMFCPEPPPEKVVAEIRRYAAQLPNK